MPEAGDATGPTQAAAVTSGDPLAAWRTVRATALDGVVVHRTTGEASSAVVAWGPAHPPVVLDDFAHSVWEQLDGRSSVGDLAAELIDAGLSVEVNALALVATAVDALIRAGLVAAPSPTPSLEAHDRVLLPGTDVGGHRWLHHEPDNAPPNDDDHGPASSSGSRSVAARNLDGVHRYRSRIGGHLVEVVSDDPELGRWVEQPDREPDERSSRTPARTVSVRPAPPLGFRVEIDGELQSWCEEQDLFEGLAAAVVTASAALPPGAVLDLGPGWIAADDDDDEAEAADQTGAVDVDAGQAGKGDADRAEAAGLVARGSASASAPHRWHERRYLSADGCILLPVPGALRRWVQTGSTHPGEWIARPVRTLSLAATGADRAETVAELASQNRSSDRLLTLRVLSGLTDHFDDGPHRDGPSQVPARIEHMRTSHPWTAHLLALGGVSSVGRSVKVRPGEVVTGRWLVWIDVAEQVGLEELRASLRAAGLPSDHVGPLAEATASARRLALGPDGDGPGGGRKVYIEDPSPDWWQSVTHLVPPSRNTPPHGPLGGAPNGAVPKFVAWKWWPDSPRVAAYWPSPGVEIGEVFPGHDHWGEVLEVLSGRSVRSGDLLLVESTGRRSLDIHVPDTPWGAAIEPVLRRLASIAGLDEGQRALLTGGLRTERIARVIGGVDAHNRPLITLYTLDD